MLAVQYRQTLAINEGLEMGVDSGIETSFVDEDEDIGDIDSASWYCHINSILWISLFIKTL